MTFNRRYERANDERQDARRLVADTWPVPIPVPYTAYGPHELTYGERRPVWAWVPFTAGPMRCLPGAAIGWNDRVVDFEWHTVRGGGNQSTVVWRQAVTVRTAHDVRADDLLPWLAAEHGKRR